MKPAALLVTLGICAAAAAPARAAGAGEFEAAARVGIGVVNQGDHPWGLAGGLDFGYGLTDAWGISATVQGSTAGVSADKAAGVAAGSERSVAALAGLTYTVDVLRLVPYASVQLGVAELSGPLAPTVTMLATALALGGDYYVTRQLRAGIMFQYLFRPQDLFSDPENLGSSPFTFSTTARLSWIF
ncbi:MAG TPA: hypothetical protein VHO06_23815 [Polyangia bacterium]|nr:hypothetical protein [Polyangia bacterium]